MSESRHQLTEQPDQMNPESISRQNSQALSETRDAEPVIESSSSSSSESISEDKETEDEYLPEDNDPGLLETFETLQITETTESNETTEPLENLEPTQIAEPIDPIETLQPTPINEPESPTMMAPTSGSSNSNENASNGGSIKSFVKDPGDFDGERKGFEGWWRKMMLYLIHNRVDDPEQRVTATLSRMGGTLGEFFAMKWTDKMRDSDDTIVWDQFKKDINTLFTDGNMRERMEWKIEEFKQGNQNTADFILKFEVMKKKSKTDDIHAMFLLKKHVRKDIIKTILGYPKSTIPTTYKQWCDNIVSVGLGYESTEIRGDQKTNTGITYGGSGQPMEIGRKNFEWNKDGSPKCHKCGIFGHIGRECTKQKGKGVKCYNCGKFGHISKNCRSKKMNNRALIEEEGDAEKSYDEDKPKKDFC